MVIGLQKMSLAITFIKVTQLGPGDRDPLPRELRPTGRLPCPLLLNPKFPCLAHGAGASPRQRLLVLPSPAIKRQQNGKIIKK